MIRVALICVAVPLLAVAALADEPAWEKFNSKEGRFTVSFPSTPKEKELKADGETVAKNVRFEAKRDGVDYNVGYIAYTKKVADKLDTLDPTDFAKRQRESTVKRTEGKVLEQKDIKLGKENRPGYELLIEVGPKAFLRQRAFYGNGRLYQLLVAGTTREAVTAAPAAMFLDSFRLAE